MVSLVTGVTTELLGVATRGVPRNMNLARARVCFFFFTNAFIVCALTQSHVPYDRWKRSYLSHRLPPERLPAAGLEATSPTEHPGIQIKKTALAGENHNYQHLWKVDIGSRVIRFCSAQL